MSSLITLPTSPSEPIADAEEAFARVEELQSLVEALQGEADLLRRRDVQIQDHLRRHDDEMRLAAKLQRDFLPKSMPKVGRVSVNVLFRPAGYVSGDFYDVPRLDEDHIGLYMLDAVGHGTPAALLTMFMKNALRTKTIRGKSYDLVSPADALCGLNEALLGQDLSLSTFATAVYAKLNCQTLKLQFSRAGHPYPMLLRDGQVTDLHADGGLLGILPDEAFPEQSCQLEPGDRLVLFSDGVESCFADSDIGDMTYWRNLMADRARLPADELLAGIERDLDTGSGSLEARDDLTIVVAQIDG